MGVATTYRVPAMRGAPILPECIPPNLCRISSTTTSRICTRRIRPTRRFDGVHTARRPARGSRAVTAIDGEVRALGGFARRLDEIDPDAADRHRAARAPDARRAHPRRGCSSSKRCAPGSATRSIYADILASSLAGQALFDYAPRAERARRVLSKLRQTPRLIQAARDNIKDPPGHLRQGRHRDACAAR